MPAFNNWSSSTVFSHKWQAVASRGIWQNFPGKLWALLIENDFIISAMPCIGQDDDNNNNNNNNSMWCWGSGLFSMCVCLYVQTPVIAVVGNDACWSQIARDQIRLLGRATACDLAVSRYISVSIYISLFVSLCLSVDTSVCRRWWSMSEMHGCRPAQKGGGTWTKYKQNANLGNSYCSYKNLHQTNTVWLVSI